MGYPGGKNGPGVFHAIINQMPPHSAYLEPFLGGGAIMRLKRPALLNVGVDLDRAAVEDFARRTIRDVHNFTPTWVLEHMAENGGVPPLSAVDDRAWLSSLRDRDRVVSGGRPRWEFAHGDGIRFLERYRYSGDELVYCDPPYLMETRLTKEKLYRCEMTVTDHRRLLRVLVSLPCSVMLSGYGSNLYDELLLRGWRSFKFQGMNRAGKKTVEVVWANFPEPVALHDYRYLGRNFREREVITRKTRRWVQRLRAMNVLSRRAMLAALQDFGDVS